VLANDGIMPSGHRAGVYERACRATVATARFRFQETLWLGGPDLHRHGANSFNAEEVFSPGDCWYWANAVFSSLTAPGDGALRASLGTSSFACGVNACMSAAFT
jgi:hypothetical protein